MLLSAAIAGSRCTSELPMKTTEMLRSRCGFGGGGGGGAVAFAPAASARAAQ